MAIPTIVETDLIEKIMLQIRNGKDVNTIVKDMQNPILVMTINMKSPTLKDANAQQQKDLLSVILQLYPSAIIFCRKLPENFQNVVSDRPTFSLKAGEKETAAAVVWEAGQFNEGKLKKEDSEEIHRYLLERDDIVRSRLSMVKLTSKEEPPHSTLAVSYHGQHVIKKYYKFFLSSHLLRFLNKVKKEEKDVQSFIVGGDFNLNTTADEMTSLLPRGVTVGRDNLTSRAEENELKSSQYIPHKDNFIWSTEIRVDDIEALKCGNKYAAFDHDPVKGKLVLQNQEDRPQSYSVMTINMNVKTPPKKQGKQKQSKAISQGERRQLLSKRISDSSPDIIFCQELPGDFNRVATGYKRFTPGNTAAVMWNHERFEDNEVPAPTAEQRAERNNTTLIAIEKAENLLSKIPVVKLTRKKSKVKTLAVSYDGRSLESEKLKHDVFSILVEFLKKVIAENGIDFCIIGGDIGLDTVELPPGLKILSYESDKENDHPCMDYYILRGPGVKCVQNIKAVHFESQETPKEHHEPSSSVRQNSTEPVKSIRCLVVEQYILPFSQSSINDGWSNACTIIAVLATDHFLSGEECFTHNLKWHSGFSDYCKKLFKEGNKLYAKLGEKRDGYSTVEILEHSKLNFEEIEVMDDRFYNNFQNFFTYLSGLLSKQVKLAFVLIFAPSEGVPVTMVLLINERGESMLIDSHTHSQTGAVVATAPENKLENMIIYIETMVENHWGLTVSNSNPFDVTAVELNRARNPPRNPPRNRVRNRDD